MWCIPRVTPEFIERMEDVLALYQKPYTPHEPIICFDEKSKQLLKDTRERILTKEGKPARRDYEYQRNGTRNIFVSVEPKGGYRESSVTKRRTKQDFAKEVKRVTELPRYDKARCIHIVLDNLNTHFEKSFIETFSPTEAHSIIKRIVFHYTPKHASWLNMAEIELSVMSGQCLKGRIGTEEALKERLARWQTKRNDARAMIRWKFTKEDARKVFKYNSGKLS